MWKEQKTSHLARGYHFVFKGAYQSLKLTRGIGVRSVELRERASPDQTDHPRRAESVSPQAIRQN